MWLNDREENIFGPFADYIHNHEGEKIKFIYGDGTELIVELFVDEYESENGLDLHDKDYEEYWEMAFKIIEIVKDDKNLYKTGKHVLVNYHCVPKNYEAIN